MIIVAATIVLGGVYIFLPSFLEESVARDIQDQLGLESKPGVELERGSSAEMLDGRFPDGRVTMEGIGFGGVRAERVVVDLDPLDLNLPASILRGTIESQKPPSGVLRAEVSEEEVARLTRAEVDAPVQDVELKESRVLVRSEASVLGLAVPVSVQGGLALRSGELLFEPRWVSALGSPVPEILV
jgi:hypothetical protein